MSCIPLCTSSDKLIFSNLNFSIKYIFLLNLNHISISIIFAICKENICRFTILFLNYFFLCYTSLKHHLRRSSMLKELIESGFGNEEDYNCAEKILYGANKVYNLGLDKKALKLSAGFGGGMGIESVCGALTAAVMVLSHIYVENIAHEGDKIKRVNQDLFR